MERIRQANTGSVPYLYRCCRISPVSCNSGSQNKSGRSSLAAVYDRRSYSSGLETVAVKPAVIDRRYRRTVTKIVHLFLIQENRPPTIARFDPFKSLLVPLDAY